MILRSFHSGFIAFARASHGDARAVIRKGGPSNIVES